MHIQVHIIKCLFQKASQAQSSFKDQKFCRISQWSKKRYRRRDEKWRILIRVNYTDYMPKLNWSLFSQISSIKLAKDQTNTLSLYRPPQYQSITLCHAVRCEQKKKKKKCDDFFTNPSVNSTRPLWYLLITVTASLFEILSWWIQESFYFYHLKIEFKYSSLILESY